jgi:two-component system OmpR family response regulator
VRVRDASGRQGDTIVSLTPIQFAILLGLLEARGEPMSRKALSVVARQRRTPRIGSRSIDTHICTLRQRLGDSADHPQIIVTIPKMGYAVDV